MKKIMFILIITLMTACIEIEGITPEDEDTKRITSVIDISDDVTDTTDPATDTVWLDPATNLMWQKSGNKFPVLWEEAMTYCDDATDGGFNNWYLPTIDELRTTIIGRSEITIGGECPYTDGLSEFDVFDDDGICDFRHDDPNSYQPSYLNSKLEKPEHVAEDYISWSSTVIMRHGVIAEPDPGKIAVEYITGSLLFIPAIEDMAYARCVREEE